MLELYPEKNRTMLALAIVAMSWLASVLLRCGTSSSTDAGWLMAHSVLIPADVFALVVAGQELLSMNAGRRDPTMRTGTWMALVLALVHAGLAAFAGVLCLAFLLFALGGSAHQ